ncbi:MAG TPA: class II aldolase/adducin family protein [Thermoanaerobaculia bacterium]|nr:class II aldolase/adducin family protein [Thermoanaerobaculia bacterium]
MVHFGGTVEVTDYAFTGTEAVGENVVRALGNRTVVLANHGNVCIGSGPESRISPQCSGFGIRGSGFGRGRDAHRRHSGTRRS